MGLTTTGSDNYGLITGGANYQTGLKDTAYGQSLPYSYTGVTTNTGKSCGISTDTSGKSGIVAKSNSITRTSLSMKFGIKY